MYPQLQETYDDIPEVVFCNNTTSFQDQHVHECFYQIKDEMDNKRPPNKLQIEMGVVYTTDVMRKIHLFELKHKINMYS